ncbi:MAG TPA: hypothetical protein VFG63_04025 [Nocardioidaceae bacterium]|nr:hypothetical protein [Nocardioidaceae bacterium]
MLHSQPQPQPQPQEQDPASSQALDILCPFTRADAIAAGLDPRVLRGKSFRRLFKGVYVSAERPPSAFLQAEAALCVHPPGAFASHVTAARLFDVPVPHLADEHVSVFVEQDRRRRKGIACHVAPAGARVAVLRGVRVCMPDRMFIELASLLSLVDLVIVGDVMVRRGWTTPEKLVALCSDSDDRYAATALRAARYVRDGVDSPMETRLRMLIVLAGLPEPEVNYKVLDERGKVIRRFDLSYPGIKLLVEYDGRQHVDDLVQYDTDIYRREDLDRWHWRLVVVTTKGIYQEPDDTLFRVRRALKERGATGLPSRLSDAWRAHFPVQQAVRRSS